MNKKINTLNYYKEHSRMSNHMANRIISAVEDLKPVEAILDLT